MSSREEWTEWPEFDENSLFESAVVAVSNHVQVEREMAIPSALGAMATACQGVVDVEIPKAHTVPTSLMLLTVARSGERKTSIENKFFEPIFAFNRKNINANQILNQEYAQKQTIWNDKNKIIRDKIKKAYRHEEPTEQLEEAAIEHVKNKPTPPLCLNLIYKDATPSALIYGLSKNIPIACLVSSEAGNIFNGKTFEQLQLFNELWTGSDISQDRKTAEPIYIDSARLTASLMVQPNIIKDFLQKRGGAAFGSGFLARFLIAWPRSKVGYRDKYPAPLENDHITPFYSRITELLIESVDKFRNKKPRRIVRFSASAQECWTKYNNNIELQTRPDNLYSHTQDHASKVMEQVSRVAAILHVFERREGDIDTQTLDYSYRLVMCFSYDYIVNIAGPREIEVLANRLILDIYKLAQKNYDGRYTFVKSTISQRGHSSLRNKENLSETLHFLKRLGHLKCLSDDRTYQFSDILLSNREPEIKNGEIYYVDELPKYKDQETYSAGSGIMAKRRRKLKPNQ